jgi:hypothetical protein
MQKTVRGHFHLFVYFSLRGRMYIHTYKAFFLSPGIDFTKLDFGRKVCVQIFYPPNFIQIFIQYVAAGKCFIEIFEDFS